MTLFIPISNFAKGPMRLNTITLGCEITSHVAFFWSATYDCPSKQIFILILTDSVIINIIQTIHTVLDIKSKHYKWKVLKLSTEAVVYRCSAT